MPGGIERDPGRDERAGQAGEAPGPAAGADRDDARAPARCRTKIVPARNEQPVPVTRSLPARVIYGSGPVAVT